MLRNISSNWVLLVVTLGATYVSTPFIIHALGQDGYGTWTVIMSMTGYISLLTLGVPAACVQYLTQDVAQKDPRKINETIGSCAALYLSCGVLACLLGAGMMAWFARYEIPPTIRSQALLAFAVMTVTVSASFFGLLPEGIFFAHHDFVRRNIVRVSGVVLRLGLTIGLLLLNASLVVIALVQAIALAFDMTVSWAMIRRRYPSIRLSLRNVRLARVRTILSFSLYVLLLSAGIRLSFQTDALVIGAYQGVRAIPEYAVANSLIVSLMDFVIAIAAVVSPMTAKLRTEQRHADLRVMFLKWSKVATALTVVASVCLLVLGPRFIGIWIDPSYEAGSGAVLQILLVSCLVFLPIRGVSVPVLVGLGKPKIPAVAFIAAGLLNLVLSIALVKPYGLAGVAVGTAIPNVLYGLVILMFACRELAIPMSEWLRYVALRTAIGAVPVLALLVWLQHVLNVHSLIGIAIVSSVAVLVSAVIGICFVYRNDPYVDVKPYLLDPRHWMRGRAVAAPASTPSAPAAPAAPATPEVVKGGHT